MVAAGLVVTAMAAGLVGAITVQRLFLADLPALPERSALWSAGRPPGMTFLGPDGAVIAHRGPRHGHRVQLGELPEHVTLAFLAAEDRRFYLHGPVDTRGVARAAVANARAGRAVEGGSTLSQQLARTLFLRPDRTLKRKVQEAVLAARLERTLSKDEILELYLNRIYFGAGAYGLSAAADTYFGKDAKDLTLAEAALLAALPKAPSRLAPTNDLPAAWSRARLIVAAMQQTGWIAPEAARAALAQAPPLSANRTAAEGDMAWVLDAAAAEALQLAGDRAPDLVVHLTVDPKLQARVAKAVRATVAANARLGVRQAAVVVLAPDGAIRAMVGGADHGASPFNRALQARRQPGSAFKPIIWATALEHGVGPRDIRSDRAVRIGNWSPQNYGGGYRGEVSVEQALRLSLNTVSVRLASEAGLDRVAALAHRFGLSSIPDHPGPSVALGAYEVSLLELTSAYQVLQNAGGRVEPYLISEIANARGDVLHWRPPTAPVPVYPQYQSGQMVRMMQGVITDGTGRDAAFGRPAAGKTGTSQNHRDAWFVGFTPDVAVGVWVGDDANRRMAGVTGGQVPARLWRKVMIAAHGDAPVRDFDWAAPLPPPLPVWEAWTDEDAALYDAVPDADQPVDDGAAFADGYGRARSHGPWSDKDGQTPPPTAYGDAETPDAPPASSHPTWSRGYPF